MNHGERNKKFQEDFQVVASFTCLLEHPSYTLYIHIVQGVPLQHHSL